MSDYLIHYGVKGMKWGVRHDRPRSGRVRISRSPGEKPTSARRGLTERQKKILKYGAIAVGSILLAYGGYRCYKIAKFDGEIFDYEKSYKEILDGVLKSKKKYSFDAFDDLSVVNQTKLSHEIRDKLFLHDTPAYTKLEHKTYLKELKDGNYMNCAKCTIARDLRSKGYDVVAAKSLVGMSDDRFNKMYKGAVTLDINGRTLNTKNKGKRVIEEIRKNNNEIRRLQRGETIKDRYITYTKWSPLEAKSKTISTILSMGEGASGDISIRNADLTSGHSMYFKVMNNHVRIFDYQTGLSFNAEKEFFKDNSYFRDYDFNTAELTRLDNLEPKIEELVKGNVIRPRGYRYGKKS